MITLTQIKLHDMGIPHETRKLHGIAELHEKTFKHYDNTGSAELDARDSLFAFNAFFMITKGHSNARVDLKKLIAFRGFLSIEMKMDDNEARHLLQPIAGAIFQPTDEAIQATHQIFDTPIALCKERYLALSPSKQKIEEYLSVFECQEPDIGIYLDFGHLRTMLAEADLTYFSELLAKHLKTTSHIYTQGFGNSICGIMQGLVYENPGKPLPELRLGKERTKAFVGQVEYQAVDQVLKAGYSIEQAFENREVIRDLISNFFVRNGFLTI